MYAGQVRDASIASLSGSSQQVLPLNGNRRFLQIENIGSANVGVNISGGTAAIGGVGTITLVPTGSATYDEYVPQNAVNVIGTAGQSILVLEG